MSKLTPRLVLCLVFAASFAARAKNFSSSEQDINSTATCDPNWSPKWDQISDPIVKQAADIDMVNAGIQQFGGLERSLDVAEQGESSYQQQLQVHEQAGDSDGAYKLQQLLLQNEGIIDIIRCRMRGTTSTPRDNASMDSASPAVESTTQSVDGEIDELLKSEPADVNEGKKRAHSSVDEEIQDLLKTDHVDVSEGRSPGHTSLDSELQDLLNGGDADAVAPSNSDWTDPVHSDDGRAYPVSTQEEIADTLNTGLSNSSLVSPAPVATVADVGKWDQFSSSATSPSESTVGFSAQTISDSNPTISTDSTVLPPDADDQKIDRNVLILKQDRDALGRILPSNEISDKLQDTVIDAVGTAIPHAIDHVISDADNSGLFSTTLGNSNYRQQIDPVQEAGNELQDKFANAIPGYKFAKRIDQGIDQWTKNAFVKKVQSIWCDLSLNPDCK
jgi:hypothetical protein